MPTLDAALLTEIKARIDLADLITEYGVDLKRVGSSAKACCPFHKEKTPSFHVSIDKGFYKCFGCGESGDAVSFVQKFEGLPFIEAVKKLAQRAGIKITEKYDPQAELRARLYQINQEVAAFYRRCLLQTREAEEARAYLQKRALDGEIAERFTIGYAPNRPDTLLQWAQKHNFTPDELVAAGLLAPPRRPDDRYYDRFHGRITFPICDPQGRIIAFSCRLLKPSQHTGKYVNSPETEIFKKATTLYAYHLARPNIAKAVPRRAIVCEGQIDVIRCHACGFAVAVASQGTSFTEEHVALLKRCADTADLVFDGDKAGVKAAIRTMGLFLAAGMPVRIVSLPEADDPDSLLLNQGAEAFRDCLKAAEDPAPYLIRRLRQQEASPDAMDATVRMARAAVTLICDCPEPVLTARFLQDAANALKLPVATLQSDLDALRADAAEAAARRQAFLARQEGAPRPKAIATEPTAPTAEEDFQPIDDLGAFADEQPLDDPLEEPGLDVPPPAEDAPPQAPSLTELAASQNLTAALCELLAHHFAEREVMDCLIRHLPPAFVHAPAATRLYDLAVAATLAGNPTLQVPTDDPAFADFLARLFASPDRVAADTDFTPLEYAKDLVRQFWVQEYDRRARLVDANSPEAFRLTLSRKRLKTLPWEAAAPYMDAMDLRFAKPVAAPAAPAPAAPTAPLPEAPTLPSAAPLPPAAPTDWFTPAAEDDAFYDTL